MWRLIWVATGLYNERQPSRQLWPRWWWCRDFFGRPYFVRSSLCHGMSSVCCLSSVVVCDVLYCGFYDRQAADVCTYQGVFGDSRLNGTMQNVVGPTLVVMGTKFGLKSAITRLVLQIDRIFLHLVPGDFFWALTPLSVCILALPNQCATAFA